MPQARLQSHTLSIPRADKAAIASTLGTGEVCHPRACSLKQPLWLGEKDHNKTSARGPREQPCFVRSEDYETEVKCQALHPNTQRAGDTKPACLPQELCKQLSSGGDREFGRLGQLGSDRMPRDLFSRILLRPEHEPCRCSENTLHRGPGTPRLNCRQEGGAAQGQSAGTNCRLGSYCLLSNQHASAGHLPRGQHTRNTAANTQGRVAAHPQAPLWKQGGDTMLPRSLGDGDDSHRINNQGTEVSNRLSLSLSHNL